MSKAQQAAVEKYPMSGRNPEPERDAFVRGVAWALPEVPDDAAIKAVTEGICESLLDLETGPLSDAPYSHAEVNGDGHVELIEASGEWPSAVIDVPQLARVAYAALRGAVL